jgi:REP element-mobilizing transposase RayT
MPQSLTKLYVHIVFSTKDRFPFLNDKRIRNEMHSYLGGICNSLESPPLIIGGISEHVHILCQQSKNRAISKVIGEIKRVSSIWSKTKGGILTKFQWQNGYGAFSIGRSEIEIVRRYIENQEDHHGKKSFQDEFREFLKEFEMEYDERYVWD